MSRSLLGAAGDGMSFGSVPPAKCMFHVTDCGCPEAGSSRTHAKHGERGQPDLHLALVCGARACSQLALRHGGAPQAGSRRYSWAMRCCWRAWPSSTPRACSGSPCRPCGASGPACPGGSASACSASMGPARPRSSAHSQVRLQPGSRALGRLNSLAEACLRWAVLAPAALAAGCSAATFPAQGACSP